jgi:hypothetical protein
VGSLLDVNFLKLGVANRLVALNCLTTIRQQTLRTMQKTAHLSVQHTRVLYVAPLARAIVDRLRKDCMVQVAFLRIGSIVLFFLRFRRVMLRDSKIVGEGVACYDKSSNFAGDSFNAKQLFVLRVVKKAGADV